MVFVSVICPTYKRHRYIPFLVQQYVKQQYDPTQTELIILDDSPEAYPFDEVGARNVRYIHDNSKRYMLWEKRNMLNKLCNGDIIVCMDDDDFYFPSRISHAVDSLAKNPKILLAGCSNLYIYDLMNRQMFLFRSKNKRLLVNCSFAYRKEILKTHTYKKNQHYNFNEEMSFTKNFKTNCVLLENDHTNVCISHACNTVPKDAFCKPTDCIMSSTFTEYLHDITHLHNINPMVYWINMDASVDRCANMMRQFEKFKFHKRISSIETFSETITPNKASTPQEVSCFSSHLKAMSAYVQDNVGEWCVVCEDDIDFNGMDLFYERIFYYVRSAPKNWEILQLHIINPKKRWNHACLTRFSRWVPDNFSTLIYVIKRACAEKLLRLVATKRFSPKTRFVADHFIYKHGVTYSVDIPFFKDNLDFTSLIHEQNMPMHQFNHTKMVDQLKVSDNFYPFN